MNIRVLTREDADIFRALRIEAINESPSTFRESNAEMTNKSHEDVVDQLLPHGRGDFVLGAFNDARQLVGVVGLYRLNLTQLSHKGTIWGMYITPVQRKFGVGRALITAAIERATTQLGIMNITLSVTATNEAAQRLYTSLGFRLIGVEQKALHINGAYYDEALMQLLV